MCTYAIVTMPINNTLLKRFIFVYLFNLLGYASNVWILNATFSCDYHSYNFLDSLLIFHVMFCCQQLLQFLSYSITSVIRSFFSAFDCILQYFYNFRCIFRLWKILQILMHLSTINWGWKYKICMHYNKQ